MCYFLVFIVNCSTSCLVFICHYGLPKHSSKDFIVQYHVITMLTASPIQGPSAPGSLAKEVARLGYTLDGMSEL